MSPAELKLFWKVHIICNQILTNLKGSFKSYRKDYTRETNLHLAK